MSQSNTQRKKQPEPPRDARSLARLLIDRFGERAVSYADHQSLKARSRGDQREAERWRWIAEVTRETLRADDDEALGRMP
ncbi:MAG: hypothetical protein ACLQJR_19735 [Stellaceae bacterium]